MVQKIRYSYVGMLLLMLAVLFFQHSEVQAKSPYQIITVGEGELNCFYKGKKLKKQYIFIRELENGFKVVRPGAKNSDLYYFDRRGIGELSSYTGFAKISYLGKKQEYCLLDGEIVKNRIGGRKKQGYSYAGPDGIRVKDKTMNLAVKFVREHTKSTDSRSEKLSKCYYYLAKHYPYTRYYVNLYPKADSMQSLAYDMLSKKTGNCHRYAASFVYIARALGYDARVVVGDIVGRGGMTPHGWAEVRVGKVWYVCDPDMEMNGVSSYMKKKTPCYTTVTRRCTIFAKNGKVSWK